MNKIVNYLFGKRAGKYLSTHPRNPRFVNYSKAKTILLLFVSDYSEQNPIIRDIIASLQHDGKRVIAIGFIEKKEITTSILSDFRVLNYKQTDIFHCPLKAYLRELQEISFDLLINLSLKPIIPLQYLALYAKASCKIGITNHPVSLYDFVMDITSTPSQQPAVDEMYLFEQIIFYLKSVQTKD